ncbi:MAG: membrane dipeptidase [Lentisphaerae bacterium]|nr:membrane dipeptidase [Lentisphaerota bacterium]
MPNPGFFDAHCDTVMKVLDDDADFLSPGGRAHLSFPGMVKANVQAQIFACFVLSSHHPGNEFERACRMIEVVNEMAASTDGALRVIHTGAELEEAFVGGPRAGILSLEGADPLGQKAETIREFYARGVRSLIFAWQDNAFSGTAFGSNTPLTKQGRRLLGLCEELGIVVDVSHLSDTAFEEVVNLSERPFVATHSNCRALCPSLRNLTDDMIRTLSDRGGVMGINLSPAFLDPEFADAVAPLFEASRQAANPEEHGAIREQMLSIPRPALDWVARHVVHTINVGGEDCIGFGSDLDGIGQTPAGINTVADYAKFIPLLREAGLSETQIEKVCCKNFLRVFSELLPTAD